MKKILALHQEILEKERLNQFLSKISELNKASLQNPPAYSLMDAAIDAIIKERNISDNNSLISQIDTLLNDYKDDHLDLIIERSMFKIKINNLINEARENLNALKTDYDWQVILEVAKACGDIGESELAKGVLDTLKTDGDFWVRLEVAKYCVAIGDTEWAKNILYTLKTDDDWRVRQEVAKAFGDIGEPELAKGILDTLKTDDMWLVRQDVATACVAIGDPKWAKGVLDTLKTDTNSDVRVEVAKSYIKLAKSLLKIKLYWRECPAQDHIREYLRQYLNLPKSHTYFNLTDFAIFNKKNA